MSMEHLQTAERRLMRIAYPKERCSVPGCTHAVHSRRLCNMHYLRLRKTGSLHLTPKPEPVLTDIRTEAEKEQDRALQIAKARECYNLAVGLNALKFWRGQLKELGA